ncbi:ABC transporter ATP-binding protein [Zoogloea oleivorans]|uniref:ABC transporter ATP-binding protein n=1 Tax=Zoogloea oleivorans TaxID=1552750 RepID=A0A6C2D7C4_9RHOO|nr:ATP-binding cassette domain-containing protein [Zoogloea oleivorans]TYC61582.1 ABC transporter ATP-binding protein [Zoogloea oleivorans]
MGEAAPLTPAPAVRVQGFGKRYRRQAAVAGVDLEVRRGEIYGLIGPDGAGKSSLMKAVAGVLAFEEGSIEMFGIRIDSEAAAERVKGRLGFMPQGLGLNLYPELSVEENIDFFARLRGVPAAEIAARKAKLLAMTRLDRFTGRPMKHLSGGMKQKLGLVCTLIHEPELIVLDEPTTGVDPVSRRDFWAILAELLREKGITALISTAYMDEAERFHRLSLMHGGRVLASGEPDAIRARTPGSVVELEAEPQVEALDRIQASLAQAESVGPRLRVFVDDAAPEAAVGTVAGLLKGLSLRDLHATTPDLEDAFVALLRRQRLVEERVVAKPRAGDGDPPGDDVAILAKDLTRDFDGFRAVDRASFTVHQGDIFGLVGANGAGKTTLIKMLTGILPPSDGEGRVAGADMHFAAQAIKARIGYTSQAFSLYQDLSVLENLRLYARIYGVARHAAGERIEQVAELTGLTGRERQLAGRLPLGIRQRLALACALVHRPRILFLDEPTSGVDPIGRRRFWDILVHLARVEQVAILITTHYMSEAEHCDRLALMHAGRIVADDPPAALKQALREEAGELLEVATDRPLAAMALLEQAGFAGVALFGRHIHLFARDAHTATREIQTILAGRGIGLASVTPRPPSLEDVFVYRITALEQGEQRL